MSQLTYRQQLRQTRIDNNLCVKCGKIPPKQGIRMCEDCAHKSNQYSKGNKRQLVANRQCPRCGKPSYQTYKICQDCRRKELAKKTQSHIEKGTCKTCGKQPAQLNKKNCKRCIDRLNHNAELLKQRQWQQVLNHYGRKCSCCSEHHIEFLTVDRMNNNGAEHRREIGRGGQAIYSWLIRNNFPDGFRILCFNCNCVRGRYGYCPHERENTTPCKEKLTEEIRRDTITKLIKGIKSGKIKFPNWK